MTITWKKRLAPIVIVQIYLWITLGLYAFGPWQFAMRDPAKVYGFVIAAHVALLLGYLSKAHGSPDRPICDEKTIKLLRTSLWLNLAVLPITSYARTGQWVPNFIGGLRDPGQVYAEALSLQAEGGTNGGAYVRILLSPWLIALFPLAIYFWGRVTWAIRGLALFVMLMVILMAISTGQRRELADMLVTLPFIGIAAHWSGVTRFTRKAIFAASAALALGIVAFTGFFVYSHISRVGAETAAYGANTATRQLPNFNNPLLAAFPAEARPGFLAFVSYVSTGYYGLALTMDREIKPTWGVGHSTFITRNVMKFTNVPDLETRSLAYQVSQKDGYRYQVFWVTAYPSFANDVGWLGTLVLLFLLGQIMAIAWINMLGGRSPYSVVFFSMTTIIAYYLPATNRMLQDGEGVVAFYVWLIIVLVHHLRSRRK